ncbi:hypothetical protein K493DRAFT_229056, partial [Basidiobolus meristosporus CBS 931.73]
IRLATEEVGCKVFVGNLSFQTTEEGLKSFFAVAGKVLKTSVITRGTRSLGYGFGFYESEKEAEEAVKQLGKKELGDRVINVEEVSQANTEVLDYNQTTNDSYHDRYRGRGRRRGSTRGRRFGSDRGGLASQPHLRKPSKTTVFVSNLTYSYGNVELQNLFQGYKIVSSHVAYMKSDRSEGFGLVEFADEAEQQCALANNANMHIDEHDISVKVARSETHSESTNNDEDNQLHLESSNLAPPSSSE